MIEINKIIVGALGTNCYIVNNKGCNDAVIIDPGAGPKSIKDMLVKKGLRPVAMLVTHGHFDHTGAVDKIKSEYNIPLYMYIGEKNVALDPKLNLSGVFLGRDVSVRADEYVSDNQVVTLAGIDFTVIYTPGHTEGGCCYYIKNEKVLFSGDTMFAASHGRTDFPTASQGSIIRSIKNRLLVLDDETAVYPGHDSQTFIGDEKKWY